MIGLILIVLFIIAYFLPSAVSIIRDHKQTMPIMIVNILLGWTFVGWVIALAWACMEEEKEENVNVQARNV